MRTNTFGIDLTQGCFDESWRTAPGRSDSKANRQDKSSQNKEVKFSTDRSYEADWEIFG